MASERFIYVYIYIFQIPSLATFETIKKNRNQKASVGSPEKRERDRLDDFRGSHKRPSTAKGRGRAGSLLSLSLSLSLDVCIQKFCPTILNLLTRHAWFYTYDELPRRVFNFGE